ncbi:hypothetical protein N0V90_002952 [Kalmusia sp. IMI 367209]|nr:hypothetical protein N0V90_002952 [Kalmusia sp. IMI 367209]
MSRKALDSRDILRTPLFNHQTFEPTQIRLFKYTMGHKHCKPGEYEQMSPDGVMYCSTDPDAHKHPPRDMQDIIKFGDNYEHVLICMALFFILGALITYYVRLRQLEENIRAVKRQVEDHEYGIKVVGENGEKV